MRTSAKATALRPTTKPRPGATTVPGGNTVNIPLELPASRKTWQLERSKVSDMRLNSSSHSPVSLESSVLGIGYNSEKTTSPKAAGSRRPAVNENINEVDFGSPTVIVI